MQPIRNLWRDRSGAFAPISALVLTVIIGFGALTIDMGYNYVMRNRLQVTADAAALAGASKPESLHDQSTIVPEARNYADRNTPIDAYGAVLAAQDAVGGNWDRDTPTFTAGLDPLHHELTTTHQTEASDQQVQPPTG